MAEARAPAKPRPPPVEVKPIIGGRLLIAILMLVLLGLIANPKFNAWVVQNFAPKEKYTNLSAWKVGNNARVKVTLVTADADRLACAHDAEIEGAHCEFTGATRPWPTPEGQEDKARADVIQPYRTSPDNHLILIAGLWDEPALSMRLHREPPAGVPVKRLNRFEADCQVKFIGQMENVKLRWDTAGRWQTEPRAWVAKAVDCDVR